MIKEAKERTTKLQLKMQELNIPLAIITDESSIAYLAGFWGYLGVEFGRPTMLLIFANQQYNLKLEIIPNLYGLRKIKYLKL